MKRTLQMMVCLIIGILIGFNLTDNISIKDTKVYDGKIVNSQIDFYDNMIKDINTMEIYDTAELTPQIMANRNGKIIVERIVGEVTNHKLDGKILNCDTDNGGYINKDGGDYICYQRVDGAKQGDKILTYFIYSPFSNEQDDVLTRLDFIIDDNAI